MSKKKEVVIKRSMWATPNNIWRWNEKNPAKRTASSLVDSDSGQRCCLGFIAVACGVPIKRCLDIGKPSELDYRPALAPLLREMHGFYENSPLAVKAIKINDNPKISDAVREKRLLALFKDSPYKLKFVD